MATIYRKTAKGAEEIQTRAHKLTPRARSALILVDGQRSDDELARLISLQAAETLALLLELGLIEPSATSAPAPAPVPGHVAAPPAGPVAPAPATPAMAGERPSPNFALVRREAVRRLNEAIGPVGESLAIKMERAKDLETLRPLLVVAKRLIADVRGAQAAEAYIAALSAL